MTNDEWMTSQDPAFDQLAGSGAFPTFARMFATLSERKDYDLDLDLLFDLGLTALLDGLAPLIEHD